MAHLTSHGSSRSGDALDLLCSEDQLLARLFAEWDAPDEITSDPGPGNGPTRRRDRGTVGKLLLEHGAVRQAAKEEVARVLHESGQDGLAGRLIANREIVRSLLDTLDDIARGVQPVSLPRTPEFPATVEQLHEVLRYELGREFRSTVPEIAGVLGRDRRNLRSARFIGRHAPSHPGPPRWTDRVPLLVRVHAAYDRLRGFPWAESSPMADTRLADRYDDDR